MFYLVMRFNSQATFSSTSGIEAIEAIRAEAGCNVPLNRIVIRNGCVSNRNHAVTEDTARKCGDTFKKTFNVDVDIKFQQYIGIGTVKAILNEYGLLKDEITIDRDATTGEVRHCYLQSTVLYDKLVDLWVKAGCPETLELKAPTT